MFCVILLLVLIWTRLTVTGCLPIFIGRRTWHWSLVIHAYRYTGYTFCGLLTHISSEDIYPDLWKIKNLSIRSDHRIVVRSIDVVIGVLHWSVAPAGFPLVPMTQIQRKRRATNMDYHTDTVGALFVHVHLFRVECTLIWFLAQVEHLIFLSLFLNFVC